MRWGFAVLPPTAVVGTIPSAMSVAGTTTTTAAAGVSPCWCGGNVGRTSCCAVTTVVGIRAGDVASEIGFLRLGPLLEEVRHNRVPEGGDVPSRGKGA